MLELQRFLRCHSVESLREQYGIRCNVSEEFPELHLFKYSQLDSPMGEQITQEARGIILNRDDDWSVVARPYDKFFNYGEVHAAQIDWNSAKVYEKLDGSLITLYWHDGWRVSTSGSPDASGEVWNELGRSLSFRDLFWEVFRDLDYELPAETGLCFIFELMTPFNRIVVQYGEPRLVLHGVRNVLTGEEFDLDSFARYNWELCSTYDFSSIEQIIHNAGELDPILSEGYIVVDGSFNRVKVKSPQYVALHHLKDTLSPRRMLEVIKSNEGEELLAYFPGFRNLYYEVKSQYDSFKASLEDKIADLRCEFPNPSRRDIGLATKGMFWQGIAFQLIFDEKSLTEVLSQIPVKKLEEWILDI